MRLALNFQRIDPTKGGAETYVVDLCHRLVRGRSRGRRLRPDSWKDGALPESVGRVRGRGTGLVDPVATTLELRPGTRSGP